MAKNAFYNSEQITNITFSSNSELVEIKEGAFSYLPNLTSLEIASTVNYIGEKAFQYSGITSFTINDNQNYQWQNDFLIDKNVSDKSSYIAVYANPESSSFSVPSNVKILQAGIFENNRNINTINLNQVTYIGNDAFKNSSLSEITGGLNIKNAGENAFAHTTWLENQNSEFIKIGTILLGYTGQDTEVVVPEGIIAENAFL